MQNKSVKSFVVFRRCLSSNINYINRTHVLQNQPQYVCAYHTQYHNNIRKKILQEPIYIARFLSFKKTKEEVKNEEKKVVKLGLFTRFKQMYRDYWYVLVPVHLITSCGWLGVFYYAAKSGVDVVSLLESLGISEKLTSPFRDSTMGYIAIAGALYKIATPLRYTVTLGGTTVSINYLKQWGYIKPIPSNNELKEMYIERREHLRETIEETKEELRQRKVQLKKRKDNLIGDYTKFKKELKDIKNKKVVSPAKEK